MLEWLQRHPWSLGDFLALAGVVATIVVAVIGPVRRRLRKLVRAGLLRAGRDERRYAAWFIGKWGVYENPYLADTENLDLSSTYVSLSFQAADTEQETRSIATTVLADRRSGNLIIEGAPGSGKSTLLKAYGVGVLKFQRRALRLPKRPRTSPSSSSFASSPETWTDLMAGWRSISLMRYSSLDPLWSPTTRPRSCSMR